MRLLGRDVPNWTRRSRPAGTGKAALAVAADIFQNAERTYDRLLYAQALTSWVP
jgi:predicted ribonuclease YlaK